MKRGGKGIWWRESLYKGLVVGGDPGDYMGIKKKHYSQSKKNQGPKRQGGTSSCRAQKDTLKYFNF